MLGSFRLRLFLVLAIVALMLTIFNSDSPVRYKVEPVLQYVMEKDYGLDDRVFSILGSRSSEDHVQPVPTSSPGVVQPPCEGAKIERHFGWYWNPTTQRQEFSPGVTLKLPGNSPVKAVLGGKVEDISTGQNSREVRIRHGEDPVSIYKGLKEVLVTEGAEVRTGDVIGKSGGELYFELHNKDGPLDPEPLFK